jgi:hypothetical protein
MCKSKWHLIIADYRHIANYHSRSGTNKEVYWSQTSNQHVQNGLPKSFCRELYDCIHEWFGRKPQIQPPHVCDLQNPSDSNFVAEKHTSDNDIEVVEENVGQDDISAVHGSESSTPASEKPLENSGSYKDVASAFGFGSSAPAQHPLSSCLVGAQPPPRRVSPMIISSSEAGGSSSRKHGGSTGIWRRTSSAHAALAEATKATGDVMVAQMKEIVGATRETENNRLEVQLKLFAEKMQYQQDKD